MAINFNGTTQFGSIGDGSGFTILNGATNASWSCWLNRDTAALNQSLVSRQNTATTVFCYELAANSSDDFVFLSDNGGLCSGTVATTLSTSTWYHLTVTYNGGGATDADKVKMYINGAAQSVTFAGTAIPSTLPTSADTTNLLFANRQAGLFLDGSLENVKIYNATLDPSEVALDMYSWAPVRPAYCIVWAPLIDIGADNVFQEASYKVWSVHSVSAGSTVVSGPGGYFYGSAIMMPRSGDGSRRHRDTRRNKFRRTGMTTGYPRWGLQ